MVFYRVFGAIGRGIGLAEEQKVIDHLTEDFLLLPVVRVKPAHIILHAYSAEIRPKETGLNRIVVFLQVDEIRIFALAVDGILVKYGLNHPDSHLFFLGGAQGTGGFGICPG